jgi:hypothetical protein
MRTSLRDPHSDHRKRILVPDRALAEYLHDLFPGSRLEAIEVDWPDEFEKKPGRPRKRRSRKRKREKKLALVNGLLSLTAHDAAGSGSCRPGTESCNEMGNIITSGFVTQLTAGSVYREKRSPLPLAYLTPADESDLFNVLGELHLNSWKEKHENHLMSPAVFDPKRTEGTSRAKENIAFMRHVWLDFEKGEFPPEEVPNLFPPFQHTFKEPRFRVVIPTTQAMTGSMA